MTTTYGKILGVLFLAALLLLIVPAAMAGDQIRGRDQDRIKDQDRLQDCVVITSLDGDRLRTRDRLKDGSCLIEDQAAAQNTNRIQWRHWNRYMPNGNVPPSSQGFALLPLWLFGF